MAGPRRGSEPVDAARGRRLREAVRARGIRKLYGLALDLGVDQSALSRWKNGGAISLNHAAMLCAHLDVSLDWLLLGRGNMDAPPTSDQASRVVLLFQKLAPPVQEAFLTVLLSAQPLTAPID